MAVSDLVPLLAVGLAAGWISSRIVQGQRHGLPANLAVGVVGAFIGPVILDALDTAPPGGLLGDLVTATIGALALLVAARAVGSLPLVLATAVLGLLVLGSVSVSINF